jgi:hypothetical protein
MRASTILATPHEESVVLAWRSFQDLSRAEAAFVSEHRLCSHLATLHVTCMPGMTNFALAEQTPADGWRWAVFCSKGIIRDEGWEFTLAGAKQVAVETQRLWFHRCDAKGLCRCAAQKS